MLKKKYNTATKIIDRQDRIIEGLNIVNETQEQQIKNSQVIIENYEDALRWYLRPSFTVPAAGLAGFVLGILIAK